MKSSDEFHSSFLLWWRACFSFLAQDWGVRFREKTMRCAKSALAAAALLAAPPRPQTQARALLLFLRGRARSEHLVLLHLQPHLQQTQGRRSRARNRHNGSTPLLSPIQARCNPRPTAVRSGTPGHPHLHCKPCQMPRSWSPSPMLLLEIQKSSS